MDLAVIASIAAGNLGVCPEATLAGVLIALPATDEDRRASFYDSSRLAHAVDYLVDLAIELKMPLSINVSLGTNAEKKQHNSKREAQRLHRFATAPALQGTAACSLNAPRPGSFAAG